MKLAIPGLGFSRNIEQIQCGNSWGQTRNNYNFQWQKIKNKKEFGFIPNRCHIILQDFLGMSSFVLSRISMGEITNLEIPAVYMCSTPIFFLG